MFSNHFTYRHSIDDHNNLRHLSPALEETWVTHRWMNRVFSFILAVTEINTYLAMKFFVWVPRDQKIPTLRDFRRTLALSLIYNEFFEKEDEKPTKEKRKIRLMEHELLTAPPHAKQFIYGKWDLSATFKYQQYTCKQYGCSRGISTYCVCDKGMWICQACFARHIIHHSIEDNSGD